MPLQPTSRQPGRVTIEFVRDLERRIASLEQRVENLATLVEGPAPWDEEDGMEAEFVEMLKTDWSKP